ncbi:peptidoglycan-binding domain-containing protein [Mesorhizobium sp. L103C105A0]|uniref:peptidoglycan-binding domain-containing protein n=1 Tax=Mesorhizobium sp. L103C105A0 TaxID=1287074 RepID=UPI001FD9BEB6|nr:peptidoglycan-binding domain-containing protein [Mesorhizobium sp. L103C105A0]
MIRLLLLLAIAFAFACGGTEAAKLDLAAVNQAQFSAGDPKGLDPAVLKAQIFLDRARFSPGLIDGRLGENFAKAVKAFQASNGLAPDGKLTQATWDKLMATSTSPALVTYELNRKDVRGPFTKRISGAHGEDGSPEKAWLSRLDREAGGALPCERTIAQEAKPRHRIQESWNHAAGTRCWPR